ncbi:terpene synthase-like isoform X1 [Temnothorax longispinosus]|uniref:terpene synthase-like isoform X1 n=1 Tax=Temnothorax longispinosus TaxID=300112 RepID=UPI003A992D5A
MTDSREVPYYCSPSGDPEEDKELLEPFKYIQSVENNRCTKLTVAFNYWLRIPDDKLRQINNIISIVYNVCILFDDIQDGSIWRDGIPVTHSVYGLCDTIGTTNYMQAIALEKAIELHPEAVKILTEELVEFNRGQKKDIYWRNNSICPTDDQYEKNAIRKAGWLVKLMVKLMKLFSSCDKDFSSVLNLMGYYHQIHNDYCNLCVGKDDKNYCDDLTEGKFSFPIIHAIKHDDDRRIRNILKQRTTDINIKNHFVELLEKLGSFKYTRDVLKELNKKIKIEIEHLGGNPLFINMLEKYEKEVLCHGIKVLLFFVSGRRSEDLQRSVQDIENYLLYITILIFSVIVCFIINNVLY